MHVIIHFNSNFDPAKLLDSWVCQHEGYYGKPHGWRQVTGFQQTPPLWALRDPGGWDVPYTQAGFTPGRHGEEGIWVTSAGNWLWLKGWTLVYSGSRHRFQEEWWSGLNQYEDDKERNLEDMVMEYKYLRSRERDWKPWETLDDHREKDALPPEEPLHTADVDDDDDENTLILRYHSHAFAFNVTGVTDINAGTVWTWEEWYGLADVIDHHFSTVDEMYRGPALVISKEDWQVIGTQAFCYSQSEPI